MIRHLVFLKFQNHISEADKQVLYDALDGLRGHLKGALDFQAAKNVSVEDQLVRGFRDFFWFDFATAADRDAYLVDARHQAVGARIVAVTEGGPGGVFVCDFEA